MSDLRGLGTPYLNSEYFIKFVFEEKYFGNIFATPVAKNNNIGFWAVPKAF